VLKRSSNAGALVMGMVAIARSCPRSPMNFSTPKQPGGAAWGTILNQRRTTNCDQLEMERKTYFLFSRPLRKLPGRTLSVMRINGGTAETAMTTTPKVEADKIGVANAAPAITRKIKP
jgi:hypothetical protein